MRMSEAFVVLLLAGAWSCGGDSDGDSSGDLDTGLAESTALRDVSQAESVSACEKLLSTVQSRFPVSDNVRHACELFGAAFTDTPSACETQADSCVSQTENGTNTLIVREDLDLSASLDCDGDVGDFAGCTVTVGEYETCLNDRMAQVQDLFAQFDCANAATLSAADGPGLVGQISSPPALPSCERLEAECPAASPFGGPDEAQ